MKLGSSRGMDTKRPRGSERSKPCHQLRLTRRSQPPYPWPPEQAQPGVSKPCRTTQLRNLDEAIAQLDRILAKLAQKDETSRRLMSIPGFGPITASAMAATIQDTSGFAGPREFAAFLGLTPKQNSSGGKQKLGRISKMGNRNLRKLLVIGAHAVLFHRKPHTDPLRMWAKKLIEKKPFKLVAVALANKMARIAFAIMRGETTYREIPT